MYTLADFAELRQVTARLRHCVTSLMSTCGDSPATRRIANDTARIGNAVDRLEIDLYELEPACVFPEIERPREMIQIPDTQYDIDFWRDVDHEGIGGQNGACGRMSRARKAR